MSFPEFGRIIEKGPEGGFAEFGTKVKEPESRYKSLAGALQKGILKAAQEDPLFGTRGKFSIFPKNTEAATEHFLPTMNKPLERGLERFGKALPYAAANPAAVIPNIARAAGGAALGQGLEEAGAPPLISNIAEAGVNLMGGAGKGLIPTRSQKPTVDYLKSKGFTDKEITPLLQSEDKLARTAAFASRGKKTDKLMRDTYAKFDNLYEGIRKSGQNAQPLQGPQLNQFLGDFQNELNKIRPMHKRLVQNSVDDLLNSPMGFNDFVSFRQDINAITKGTEGGKAVINILKDPIDKALSHIDPRLAEEFTLANQLYSKRANVAQHLRPDQYQGLVNAGEVYALATGIADLNVGILTKILGLTGARKLATELLINPKMQNLSLRMLEAIKKNHLQVIPKLLKDFKKEYPNLEYQELEK